jgi:hypothetical protein
VKNFDDFSKNDEVDNEVTFDLQGNYFSLVEKVKEILKPYLK